jgi:rare lipoprotein A
MKYLRFVFINVASFLILLFVSLPNVQAQGKRSNKASTKKIIGRKFKSTILYGQASFYASKFRGRRTANGETFSQQKMTAACNALPLGTWIQVTNLKNGKIVVVKTNDRLHPKTRRLVDLTRAAAKKLGYISRGLTRVRVEVLDQKLYKK